MKFLTMLPLLAACAEHQPAQKLDLQPIQLEVQAQRDIFKPEILAALDSSEGSSLQDDNCMLSKQGKIILISCAQ